MGQATYLKSTYVILSRLIIICVASLSLQDWELLLQNDSQWQADV